MLCGRSGSDTALNPRSAFRWISWTATSGSASQVRPIGMTRLGYGLYHSSYSQSFQARRQASPSSGSSDWINLAPQNPVRKDGKFEHGRDAGNVHVLDASVDVVATRAHVVVASRREQELLHVVVWMTGHGIAPTLVQDLSLVDPGLGRRLPVSRHFDHLRRLLGDPGRQPTLEDVGRLHQVVVDRNQGIEPLPRLRVDEMDRGVGGHNFLPLTGQVCLRVGIRASAVALSAAG